MLSSIKPSEYSTTAYEESTPLPDDDDNIARLGGLSCCGSCRFFVKHSCRDLLRNKCQFGLAFCSVFVVVLSVMIVNTIISKGPLIFLKLAESQRGGYDGMFFNNNHNAPSNWYDSDGDTKNVLNYTQITELYGKELNLSPRFQTDSVTANNSTSTTELEGFEGNFMAMDTQREKEIALGPKWPFEPLGEGECLASGAFKDKYILSTTSTTIYFNIYLHDVVSGLVSTYNELAVENHW